MRNPMNASRHRSLLVATALLGSTACGIVEEIDDTAAARGELRVAPASVLALELPGCDALVRLAPNARERWELEQHPADAELAVLTRDGCPVCVDRPERAERELRRLTLAASGTMHKLASSAENRNDDPVPIRGGGSDSSAHGEGGPQPSAHMASSAVPDDDPVPIREDLRPLDAASSAGSSSSK
jgi:hypothetical protein